MKSIIKKARYGIPFFDEVIIDSHCHFGNYYANIIPYNSEDELIKNMDRIGINKACFATSTFGSFGNENLHNEQLAGFIKRYPNRILGYVSLPLNYRETLLDFYLKYESMGLSLGVKMHTYGQPHSITDTYLHPIYERINKKNGLVLHHEFGDPDPLEELLKAYPNISFIAGHLFQSVKRYVSLFKKYNNLYVSSCASLRYDEVAEFTKLIGSEKILYGSDFTILDTTFGFGPIVYAKITNQEKLNILGLNMEKILNKVKKT